MRKRNLMCLFDTIFWYILYAFPFLSYFFMLWGGGVNSPMSFPAWLDDLDLSYSSFIFTNLKAVFGTGGVLPLFYESILFCFSWFISCVIIHIMVDVLLFIPRLSHNWLEKFTSGRD